MPNESSQLQLATFGGGCFWCTEAVFKELRGVKSVVSGYSGGHVGDPTYEQVCGGRTGHAEVVQITFDPAEVTYAELLDVFFRTHDPTTLNRQGHDAGPQYRSAIFYHGDQQRELAEQIKRRLGESEAFDAAIVTEITPLARFYAAEDDHQNYFARHPEQAYCSAVIRPKVERFRAAFGEKLGRAPA